MKDCQSDMLKPTWEPRWIKQNRPPNFIGGSTPSISTFGATNYLWGNVPAIDLIKLTDNEGVGFKQDIDLLFAGRFQIRYRPSFILIISASCPLLYFVNHKAPRGPSRVL